MWYFEKTYLGEILDDIDFSKARYPVERWNMFEKVKNDVDFQVTNNEIEGWHRAFNDAVGCKHPKIFKFVEVLKGIHSKTNFDVDRLRENIPPEKRCRLDKIQTKHVALFELVKSYDTYEDKLEYLVKVAECCYVAKAKV